ncbi:bile acid:sodium symporter [Lampropedia puyangensis]|uniref:Bile acid:sodium symporter n=1 Tax=Lampropedia puyangensis TaxID=1330072 RepID=A0A4S8FGH0_9BURK|nr:bile acid:sodium symporter family protein [Lampropedia puyangensis]THU04992.1 bile acid:sodium symporter [Lampropedia puyangensis]
MKIIRWLPDTFVLLILAAVLLASLLPVAGQAAQWFGYFTQAAIALLFFMHGAKLSAQQVRAGLGQWRLHLAVFACTFALFPLLGWLLRPVFSAVVGQELTLGLLFLCALPSTVQSSIAFTAMAGGNVAAAVCSAATSSLLGVFVTPLLVVLMFGVHGDFALGPAVLQVALQLLLPFALGQWARRWIGAWVQRHRSWLKQVDNSSILLVVYGSFSAAVVGGIWQRVDAWHLALLLVLCVMLLALVFAITLGLGQLCGFAWEDRKTLFFCGSKKSLTTGIPLANVLFPAVSVGLMILPTMLFHQIQLLACAYVARRWGHAGSQSQAH